MKSFFLFILIFTSTVSISFAQSLDEEIDKLSQMLIQNLNSNKKVKKVAVADFSYKGQSNTRIGKYLSDELSAGLTMNGARFTMVNREKVREEMTKNKQAPKQKEDISEFAKKGVDAGTSGEYESQEEKNEDWVDAGLAGMGMLFKGKKMLSGTDVIIYGTIEDKGDYLRVILEASKNNKSGDIVSGARGNISKTPEIRELLQGSVPHVPIASNGINTSTDPFVSDAPSESGSITYQHENLLFEVIGCQQDAKTVECKVNILATDKDIELTIYKNSGSGTRIIDANGGYEFNVTEMRLADQVTTGNRVKKIIIADFPIEAVFRFSGVNRSISSISRLELNAYHFVARLGPIPVQ